MHCLRNGFVPVLYRSKAIVFQGGYLMDICRRSLLAAIALLSGGIMEAGFANGIARTVWALLRNGTEYDAARAT